MRMRDKELQKMPFSWKEWFYYN